ncbi:MAG: hypothetical protein ACE5HU_06110 [Acidobacteriota bacterium]
MVHRPPWLLLGAVILLLAQACEEKAINDRMVIDLTADRIRVVVETGFKAPGRRSKQEAEEVERYMDRHSLGRDPWLRGFARAGATDVTVQYEGPRAAPARVRREGTLDGLESVAALMPDAIANLVLMRDRRLGRNVLGIVHIDVPESLRRHRHELEREVQRMARLGYDWSESVCDLYDYLHREKNRRRTLMHLLTNDSRLPGDRITPEELVLLSAFHDSALPLLGFSLPDAESPPSILQEMSFQPFDHDLLIRLPVEAVDNVGFVALGEEEGAFVYGLGSVDATALLDLAVPRTDPALDPVGREAIAEEIIRSAPFTCRRFDAPKAIEELMWERILPRSHYELTWPTR